MNKFLYSSMSYLRSNRALRIILIYSVISLLWIFFSDELVFKLFSNVVAQRLISIMKGSLFVIVTSLILYKLIRAAINEVMMTQQKLQESEQYSRMLFETSSIGLTLARIDGKFVDVNPAFANIIGRTIEEALKLNWRDITPKSYDEKEEKQLEILTRTGFYGPYEKEYIHLNGHYVPVRMQGSLIERNGEQFIWSSVEDITEDKLKDLLLRESEEKFRTLTETTSAAIFIFKGETFRYLNTFAEHITGYKQEELINKNFWDIVHPEYRELIKERGISRQRGEFVLPRYEFKLLTKSGEERWVDFTAGMINFEGEPAGIGTAIDITERKHVEEKLLAFTEQMRSLAAHLQTVREEERASIAREMHDVLGQILTSLKMNITFTKRELEESTTGDKKDKILGELVSMNQTVDRAVTQVRKLITQLRPELIDKLGLIPALEWYSEEYQKTTKINCEFKTNLEEFSLNPETNLAIFRIAQEALTNAAKHSEAKSVKIKFEKNENEFSLEIVDDGNGILDADLEGKKSFGLMGMRERASLIGGKLEIGPAGEKGTLVRLVIKNK